MLSEFICQCPGIQNDASCSVRVTNSSAILCGCFSTSKVATQVKGVGVRCTRGSVRLSDIQAVRKHLNDSIYVKGQQFFFGLLAKSSTLNRETLREKAPAHIAHNINASSLQETNNDLKQKILFRRKTTTKTAHKHSA